MVKIKLAKHSFIVQEYFISYKYLRLSYSGPLYCHLCNI